MKRWKAVAKNVIEISSAFFGLTLIGLIFGVTTALIFWEVPVNIFMQAFAYTCIVPIDLTKSEAI